MNINLDSSTTLLQRCFLQFFPIAEWLPKYSPEDALSDLIAGVTVGLTVIPQGIAYALVANLPAQYGLYSAFMGSFLYVIFGSSKDITIGPTAISSLLTAEYGKFGTDYAVLLTFLTGCIILGMGLLRLGFVVDFISVPVTAGFTSAAAVTIASGQISALLGLKLDYKSNVEGIIGTWLDVIYNFDSIRSSDTILGFVCLGVLLALKFLHNVTWFDPVEESYPATRCQSFWRRLVPYSGRKFLSKLIWMIATSRNAVVVISCASIAYGFDPNLPTDTNSRNTTFILTGNIDAGLPSFQLPPFSTNDSTSGTIVDFRGMATKLGSGLVVIPLLAILENMAIAKAFAGEKHVDANQEMFALGVCNLFGSFVRSMPTTGSFSRTAVNAASGVKTTFGGIYCGALVLLALGLLMPFCAYIPKSTLAAVIITAVIFSIEYEVVRPMWRSKKLDLIPALVTFTCCIFWALEYGILVGVGVQIVFVLYNIARPKVIITTREIHSIPYLMVKPDRALIFPSIAYVRSIINKAATTDGHSRYPVVLDCSHISSADFTAAKGLKAMISDFRSRNQPIIFYKTTSSVADTFLGVNIEQFVVISCEEDLEEHLMMIMSEDELSINSPEISNEEDSEAIFYSDQASTSILASPSFVRGEQGNISKRRKDDVKNDLR